MRRGEPLPPVWLAPGAVSDPRALLRWGALDDLLLPVGPVGPTRPGEPQQQAGSPEGATGRTGGAVRGTGLAPSIRGPGHAPGVGGVEHASAPGYAVPEALQLVRWCATRGLRCVLAVRGRSTGDLATAVGQVRRSLDADAVAAVEVDLRGADDQTSLKAMARVREVASRDLLLLARLSALQPDLVGAARGAVAGGAGAVVVCGSVRLGPDRWWSGASTAAMSRAGVRELRTAAEDQRWPAVPVVAAGGVHDVASARAALADGAAAVQLGTALWADPTLLWTIVDDLRRP